MNNDSFVVIGLGTFGATVASELANFGNKVIGIDIEEGPVSRLADRLTQAMIADARDEEALREAGAGDCDVALIAIGEDLEANIICTMNVKMLGVPCIWVKAVSKTHHRILSKIGADRVVEPEQEVGRHVAQILHNPLIRDYLSLGNGFYIIDIRVPDTLNGDKLGPLLAGAEGKVRCLGVMRGIDYLPGPVEDIALETDDKLLLLGGRQDLRDFSESFR
ncbi:MAG: TrkA family potassium uptake protein [Halieaceae bacterium]|nr:TrkA family potassium uptake protein [Halieaceae bacterium]MCP5147853.1 TrkA family potassium uptake protein [Pseudomonadales bacterium]MCP5167686.1 TrkA family potassium uptake protein [Pseudomonadales bacterium]MCP5187472.1 TrkA family potassium uptake protein [Pseudomonadales bacterium]